MNNTDYILEQIKNILNDITGKNNSRLTLDSTVLEISGWDSIVHIEFIVSLESEFNIKFSSVEMSEFKSIREISEIIHKKITA